MKVIYLNQTYRQALHSHGVDISTYFRQFQQRASPEEIVIDDGSLTQALMNLFSYEDYQVIAMETELFLEKHQRYALFSYWDSGTLIRPPRDNQLDIDAMREAINSTPVSGIAIDPEIMLLYADPKAPQPERSVIETILNALALIMPVGAVMKTDLFRQFLLT